MTKVIFSFFFWWFISYFFYFVFRLFWHISQKKRITIEIIEFIFSIYFDLFFKRNALRSKSLMIYFFVLFWQKQHYDKTSIRSNFNSFSTFLIFDSQFILIKKRITIEIIDDLFFRFILTKTILRQNINSFKFYSVFSLQLRQMKTLWQMIKRSKNLTKKSKNLKRNNVEFANVIINMIAN